MNSEMDDEQFFKAIRIETSFVFNPQEGKNFVLIEDLDVTQNNISELTTRAAKALPESIGDEPFCIISRQSIPEETFQTREHFVLEGLGFGWSLFPKGFGTCDRINQEFSRHELEWLRYGAMGMCRPLFVSDGKKGPPEFHSPTKNNRRITFTRNSAGRRVIELRSDVPLDIPDQGQDGELKIKLSATESNSTSVSLALHKMAYLALLLAQPEIVLDSGFHSLVEFLNSPNQQTFRPFREQFISGASPGVTICFYVNMTEILDERKDDHHVFGVDNVYVAMTIHHMIYFLSLMGAFPETEWPESARYREYEPLGTHQKTRTALAIKFEKFARTNFVPIPK